MDCPIIIIRLLSSNYCYCFSVQDLQDFLNLYFAGCKILQKQVDFYDLMYAYLRRASADNVYVAEIFFNPQSHTEKGIPFSTVVNGLYDAIVDAYRDFGIRASLILGFLRHLSEDAAYQTLEEAKPYLDKIVGIGLDSTEVGNPPSKFKRVYLSAAGLGLKLVAHAGEEGGPLYIKGALDDLRVSRVDHGVQCLKDPDLIRRLVKDRIPLTTSPLSNLKLQILSRFFGGRDVTKELLTHGIMVTVNSDDPAYFGGYITDNFLHTALASGLDEKDICKICRNAFQATFLSEVDKQFYLEKIDKFNVTIGCAAPPKSVTFFGSSNSKPKSEEYDMCVRASKLLVSRGFMVVTGGYSGLMEATSFGAQEAESCENAPLVPSLGVLAPCVFSGEGGNPFIKKSVQARNLPERLERLVGASEYFFVCGGGIGTLTELLYVWDIGSVRPLSGCLSQRVYVLRSFWEESLKLILSTIVKDKKKYERLLKLLTFVDGEEEFVGLVEEDWKRRSNEAIL